MVEKTKGRKEEVVTREYTINLHKRLHGWYVHVFCLSHLVFFFSFECFVYIFLFILHNVIYVGGVSSIQLWCCNARVNNFRSLLYYIGFAFHEFTTVALYWMFREFM